MVEALAMGMDRVADMPAASLERIAKGLTFDVEPAFTVGAGAVAGVGAGGPPLIIHNHFGPDSIRSDRDVYKLTEQIERSLRLRGVGVREPA